MNIHSSTNLPAVLTAGKLPVVAAPLFIISTPDLVIAQCKAGVIGSFPALNAREKEGEPIELERWLKRITEELDRHNQENPDNPAAPFAVNQIVHRSNPRLMRDIEICVKWNVPVWITSLGARPEVNEAAHSCGGTVLHDIINNTFARKAIERKTGARGLRSILEEILLDTMFDLPGLDEVTEVVVNEEAVSSESNPLMIYAENQKEDQSA